MLVCWLYLFTDIIVKKGYTSNTNQTIDTKISYKTLDNSKIADSNIYIYGYQGDILTSKGAGFLDRDNDVIVTANHNTNKPDNAYYIYDSRVNQKIKIDDMKYLSWDDLAVIYSQEYLNNNMTSMWTNWNFYHVSKNIDNSWYIYLSWQAESWQSWSPVYCDDKQYICGIIVANNETTQSVKILLINQNMVNDIKTIWKSN